MAYRELRNFTEILRTLGYPRLVSVENFRKPNFPLVAELLQWLVSRFDSSIELTLEIDTEQERVIFIKTAAQLMAMKAHVKLDTAKLYMADGRAVQELLTIADLLYKASQRSKNVITEMETGKSFNVSDAAIAAKISELKKSRQLASEITQRGAVLYDLLAKELEMRDQRAQVLNRQLDMPDVERSLRDALVSVEKEIQSTNFKIENVASDEANLDAKIEKKRAELDRHQKRLQALKAVRPAFMDEFEKLEEELSYIYDLYVLKFRCLVFLEQQLEDVEKSELGQRMEREEQIKKMVDAMKEEQLMGGDGQLPSKGFDGNDDMDFDDSDKETPGTATDRARRSTINTTTAKRSATGRARVLGSMASGDKEESLDSDLELDGDDDASDLDSEDEMELMNLTGDDEQKQGTGAARPKAISADEGSDNDF